MVLPNLIHPCDIVIAQIIRGETFYDEDAREPIQQADREVEVTVPGQPSWIRTEEYQVTKGGTRINASGYVLFRKVDLDAISIEIQESDQIKKMGHVETNVYVVATEWLGHYPDQDGPALIKAYFEDRSPSKGNGV